MPPFFFTFEALGGLLFVVLLFFSISVVKLSNLIPLLLQTASALL